MTFFKKLVAVICILPSMSSGEELSCGPEKAVKEWLQKNFGETVSQRGVLQDGKHLMEITSNTKTGTWTLLITDTQGVSCMTVGGEAFDISVNPGDL